MVLDLIYTVLGPVQFNSTSDKEYTACVPSSESGLQMRWKLRVKSGCAFRRHAKATALFLGQLCWIQGIFAVSSKL